MSRPYSKTFGLVEYQYIPDQDPLPPVHSPLTIESEGAIQAERQQAHRHQAGNDQHEQLPSVARRTSTRHRVRGQPERLLPGHEPKDHVQD